MSAEPKDNRLDSSKERLERLRPALKIRAAVVEGLERFLRDKGSLAVDTPARVRTPGTDVHLDAEPSGHWFLITSPEFHMKRLVAAGYGRIHQICHCFRSGEQGPLHNPEFLMLEWYWPGEGYLTLAAELQEMLCAVAQDVLGTTTVAGGKIDLSSDWERITVGDAFERYAGWRPGPDPDEDRFFRDLIDKVEPHLGVNEPTILYEYPAAMAALSRRSPANPEVAERFELYADGLELVNAFDELCDPDEQRRRFERDLETRRALGKAQPTIDEHLIEALRTMPRTAGAALGVDRLVMLFLGAMSIEEVVGFPAHWV